MTRTSVLLFLTALPVAGLSITSWPQDAAAQPAGDKLTDQQRHGRQVFAQSCGVCHLPPSLNARTFGPVLNKGSGNGDDELMRGLIMNGTAKHARLQVLPNASEIDAIIAYVRTVPPPAASAPR